VVETSAKGKYIAGYPTSCCDGKAACAKCERTVPGPPHRYRQGGRQPLAPCWQGFNRLNRKRHWAPGNNWMKVAFNH